MILSTFGIDQRLLKNRNDVHREVMRMFQGNRKEENVLYMLFEKKGVIVVQSDHNPVMPANSRLQLEKSCSLDSLPSYIKNKNKVRIFTICEPTKKMLRVGKKRTNVTIFNKEERMSWLERKMKMSGATLINAVETGKETVYMSKSETNKKDITLYSYCLTVGIDNHDAFLEAMRCGIGRSKAYGAGLFIIVS